LKVLILAVVVRSIFFIGGNKTLDRRAARSSSSHAI
jgi:hypothetical protein